MNMYVYTMLMCFQGETSAGKSTFVNLLLGVELLPQSPLTCTSPICRISNRVRKRIVLIDSEDNQQIIELENTEGAEEMRRRLKGFISATQAGEKYKAVDICWPIACLQNKIMIVDTPGIGPDNDILANRLFDYLPSALAFIYIINPTNAGGVQSDRLQRILEEQEKRKCMGVKSVFDPRRAIFVCNKWDQMHEDEEQVFDHIKEKLSNKWTNFDSSKIYKVSAWEEMQRSKNGQPISDNFKSLLRGIDQMIPACLQEKISRHVNWQRYFLERLNFKLTARITNAMRTEDDKRMMAKQVVKRIQKVRENIKYVQSKLKSVAKEQCQKSSELLNLYLHLPEIRNNLFSWTDDVLPDKDDIETIEKEVMRFVEECIARQIKTWLKQSNNGGLSEFMAKQFKKECAIIETDCTEIDDIILGRTLSTCELDMVTPRRQSDRDTSSSTNISTAQKVAILATFPIWMPLSVVVGLFAVPVGIGYFTVGKISDIKRVKEYRQNKQVYVKNIAEKMLGEITIQFLKEKVFGQFLNEMNNQIDQFCDSTVPRRIVAGEILIKGIKKDIRQPVEIRKQCILVESDLKSAYGRVLFIDIEYFDKFKLSQTDVRRKDLSSELEVLVNGEWKDTVVKQMKWSYSNKSDCSVLSEIQKLRNIKHEHILDVLGITLATEKNGHILEIYTEKCDKSLETAIFRSTKQAEPWRCIHLYLCQCLEGLTYLHEHGLIHGNVKPSNMLVSL
ncbi:uncharacterized protein LOC134705000 [Mytilus trossulus]|uniref:uncharacterized protein LOC134705000 n=1 Tax=Mytilus trossulus TaxID=6551 RepID=UPI003004E160